MAVAMTSLGSVLGLHSTLKAVEKQPISKLCLFTTSFGLDPVQPLCINSRRLSSSASLVIAQASAATAIEVSTVVCNIFLLDIIGLIPFICSVLIVFWLRLEKQDGSSQESDSVPTPKVIIDQDSDPDATVVEITFGDRLGALLDTMNALKSLGLNVVKANVYLDSSGKHNKFSITKASTGRKVEDPELLEAIRLTIINNLLEYHPESSSQLAMGATFGVLQPSEVDVDIATHVHVYDDSPERSLLVVESADRPGLLVDLVKIITEINIAVESGEFDTEGLLAKAKFHVSYKGQALRKPLQQVIENSLRYYLRRPTTEDSSF